MKIKWAGQGALSMAKDEKLLHAMKKSGCEIILIGFESLDKENLAQMNKSFNYALGERDELVKRIHDAGIGIYATFVFGYSGFGKGHFYSIRENGVIIACCFITDQQANKQYKMMSYGGIYRLISKLPTKLLGYPEFPKADSIINHGVVSYLYIKDNDKRLCADFLRSAAVQTDFSLLLWGGFKTIRSAVQWISCDPLNTAADSIRYHGTEKMFRRE